MQNNILLLAFVTWGDFEWIFFFTNFSSTVSSLHSRVDSLEKSNTKLIEEVSSPSSRAASLHLLSVILFRFKCDWACVGTHTWVVMGDLQMQLMMMLYRNHIFFRQTPSFVNLWDTQLLEMSSRDKMQNFYRGAVIILEPGWPGI